MKKDQYQLLMYDFRRYYPAGIDRTDSHLPASGAGLGTVKSAMKKQYRQINDKKAMKTEHKFPKYPEWQTSDSQSYRDDPKRPEKDAPAIIFSKLPFLILWEKFRDPEPSPAEVTALSVVTAAHTADKGKYQKQANDPIRQEQDSKIRPERKSKI
jgi:hypothetical protein